MKKIFFTSAICISLMCFTTCNKHDYTTFKANYTESIDISTAPIKNATGIFNDSVIIDPVAHAEVNKHRNLISNWEILNNNITFTSVDENFILKSLNINFSAQGLIANWEFSDVVVSEGNTIVLSNKSGQWDTIKQILLAQQIFTIYVSGETNVDKHNFNVRFNIDTEVTAVIN